MQFYMDSSSSSFNLTIFTDITKNICTCSAVSIFIIVLFIISPLSNFFKTSAFMKIIAIVILCYIIYLNNKQINLLKEANKKSQMDEVKSQITINTICSYVFTVFIGLLIIFVIKSFF
jgi:hypothetical protein